MILTRLIDLPRTVRGFTVPDEDGNYNVYINARLSDEQQKETMKHELRHILCGDFQKSIPAHIIEKQNSPTD